MIVNGFIEPITKELPMEYAVELNRLIELQMEGSMADAAAAPPLPTQKTRGWEFTDLSGLELDAYTAATDGDPEARSRADGVLNLPEGSDHLVVQVDGAVLEGGLGRGRRGRAPARTSGRVARALARALSPPA